MNPISRMVRDWRNERELERRRRLDRASTAAAHEEYTRKLMNIDEGVLALTMTERGPNAFTRMPRPKFNMTSYTPPFKGIAPADSVLAMDDIGPFSMRQQTSTGMFAGISGFPGFPYLTELTQINEYRDITDATANEMTRKWIEFRSISGSGREEIIKKLNVAFKKFHVKEWFNWAAKNDGYFGRAQLFLDFGDEGPEGDEEIKLPLLIQPEKIAKGSFKRIKGIEPITTYPAEYNASDPLAVDYYVPSAWWVYSKRVHASRLLEFNSRPLPDLLKPVFNFSGISLTQLAQPYVDYWLQSRDSVSRLLKNFSTSVLKTDMTGIMQGENYEAFKKRMMFYTAMQNNQGVFLLDKLEEFDKVQTTLSGLDSLLAQAQEHMASVAKTPLTILFGLSPKGLTATAETDITIYNNHVNASQEAIFRRPLEAIMHVIMCSELGEIYDDITFDFIDLVSMNGKEQALIRKSDGETDVAMITAGVVTPEEVRAKVAADPDSGYNNLDVNKVPKPPAVPPTKPKGGAGGSSGAPDPDFQQAENSNDSVNPLLQDAARMTMDDAERLAQDSPLANDSVVWQGNGATGGIGGKEEHPSVAAMKSSQVAQRASNVARTLGTKAAHKKAQLAHVRALNAHRAALDDCDQDVRHVHEAYCDAHEAAAAVHQMESAPQPEEVEP